MVGHTVSDCAECEMHYIFLNLLVCRAFSKWTPLRGKVTTASCKNIGAGCRKKAMWTAQPQVQIEVEI
jgi:hypothetical protein